MPLLNKIVAKLGYQRINDTKDKAIGEIASAISYNMKWYQNWLEAYYNSNPVHRSSQWTGYHLYEAMDGDAHIYNTMSMRKVALLSRPTVVRSATPGELLEDKKAAFVAWILDHIVEIIQKKREMLSAKDFGFSINEIIYGYRDIVLPEVKVGKKVKFAGATIENALCVVDLKAKVPSAFAFDGFGNLGMVKMTRKLNEPLIWGVGGFGNEPLTAEENLHFLVLTHDPRFGSRYGWPLKASFFWDFLQKKAVRIYRMIFVEKYGMPIYEGTYPPGTDKGGPDGTSAFFEVLKSAQKNDILMHPEGFAVKILEAVTKSGTIDVFQNVLDFCDGNISEVGLGHRTAVSAGDNSSPFQNTDQKSALRQDLLEMDAAELDAVFNDQLIPRLIDFNFTPNGLYPYVKTVVEPETDLDKEIFRLQAAYNMKIPLSVSQQREKFGWVEPGNDPEDLLLLEPELQEKGSQFGKANGQDQSNTGNMANIANENAP
jgi:uncharacterized protein DUF935